MSKQVWGDRERFDNGSLPVKGESRGTTSSDGNSIQPLPTQPNSQTEKRTQACAKSKQPSEALTHAILIWVTAA